MNKEINIKRKKKEKTEEEPTKPVISQKESYKKSSSSIKEEKIANKKQENNQEIAKIQLTRDIGEESKNIQNNKIRDESDENVYGKIKERAEISIKAAKEYFNSAEEELAKERNNSSVVLYFKLLVALVDLFVLQKTGDTSSSSHNDKFRITQKHFSEVYDLLDKDFPFYQNSYFQIISKELAEVIKNDAKIMAGKTEIEL